MSKKCKVLRNGIRQRDGKGGWKRLRIGTTVSLPDRVAEDFATADPPMVELVEEKKTFFTPAKKVLKPEPEPEPEGVEDETAADEVVRAKDKEDSE